MFRKYISELLKYSESLTVLLIEFMVYLRLRLNELVSYFCSRYVEIYIHFVYFRHLA